MAAPVADAVSLKAEGNALYVAKDYPGAHAKYEAAIKLDEKNSVLYANRGACSFAMDKFADAAADCRKAVELDPKYTKAWVRLAVSLKKMGQIHDSMRAYGKAMESLPPVSQRTPTDDNLQKQCEDGLRDIHGEMAEGPPSIISDQSTQENMPWIRARKMEARLFRSTNIADLTSSAWVISEAYREFKRGLDIINQVKKMPNEKGSFTIIGPTGGLNALTNGIIRDPRVFHIENPHIFQTNYNLHIEMEATRHRAWPPLTSDAKYIKEQALKRLKDHGWDSIRLALATTLRSWIMRAILEQSVLHNPFAALDFLNRTVEVLEWGRRVWKDVSPEDRGKIFTDTFLVGVKNLQIEALMMCYSHDSTHTSLESVHDAAKELIEAVDRLEEPSETEPGFVLSFFVYPKAHAYAMLGLNFRDLAESLDKKEKDAIRACYHESGAAYKKAALLYPVDDENYCYYLICSLDMLYLFKGAVRAYLDIMEKIRMSLPKAMEIWEHSSLLQSLSGRLSETIQKEKDIRKLIARGKLSMDTVIGRNLKPIRA